MNSQMRHMTSNENRKTIDLENVNLTLFGQEGRRLSRDLNDLITMGLYPPVASFQQQFYKIHTSVV